RLHAPRDPRGLLARGRAEPHPPLRRHRTPRRTHRRLEPRNRMKWLTRERPKTDRIACPWLIRRFIDSDAEILYVPRDDVLDVAKRENAKSFDAPDAGFTHR